MESLSKPTDGKHLFPLEEGDEVKTLPCSVCGKELKLLGYGELWKEGKRRSRWPTWEKCDKKLHDKPSAEKHSIETIQKEVKEARERGEAPEPIVKEKKKAETALRYQKLGGDVNEFFANDCIKKFKEKTGREPKRITVHPDDYEKIKSIASRLPCPLETDPNLTPKANYMDIY